MIRQLQDSDFMRNKVGFLRSLAHDVRSWLAGAEADDTPAQTLDQIDVDEMVTALEKLDNDEALWTSPSDCWLPHDSDAAILQSCMDDYYRENDCITADNGIFGEALSSDPLISDNLVQLSFHRGRPVPPCHVIKLDPRWLLVLIAKIIKRRRGAAPFVDNTRSAAPLAENARIVLFGDWASGIPNAISLARTIWSWHLQPELGTKQLHLIHLGDAYYAGLGRDYAKRFTPYWPVPLGQQDHVCSWCLPGNHDMYSGGHGFFDMLNSDPRFGNQGGSSYFLFENEHWQVFGLDTAFAPPDFKGDIGDMYGEQAAWVAQRRAAAHQKKCLLLTHHQPFSAFAAVNERLERRLRPIRETGQITAWFWGHEHWCAVYARHDEIPYPVLLGHGGFPEKRKARRTGAPPMDFDWSFTDAAGFVIFGFAVLDFAGDQIQVRLINADDEEQHRFTIT
jgi:hypothetical protein